MRWIFSVFVLVCIAAPARTEDWRTYYEKSGFLETPRYEETVRYCRRLAQASPWIEYTTFGTSPRGRDLALLIVDRNGNFTAEKVRKTDNVVFLIQAGIHAGEIDGKDAGLMLIRDIAIDKKLSSLLDEVTILFMPIFNVDGHERFGPYGRANQNGPKEMGWRTTAVNLNLNRDYLKADAAEMQAWLRLYNEWLPEFFADCHVTDGADYQYVVTYAVELFGNMDERLTAWAREKYVNPLGEKMDKSGFPIIRYNTYRSHHEPQSGLVCWASPPRFSTGYAAQQNRPAILIETHVLKDYKTRVTATYEVLKHTLEILNQEHASLKTAVLEADRRTASPDFRAGPFPLTFRSAGDSVLIDFLGYDCDVVDSDVTGGKWHRFGRNPVTMQIPYFNHLTPDLTAELPEAYILPPKWTEVIKRLKLHGVELKYLGHERVVPVRSYRFTDPKWASQPYEGRFTVDFTPQNITEARVYPKGSVVVDMNQRTARVVAQALEPRGQDSFVFWGFFNTIFERKEYIESYIIEDLARKMLATDEELKREFEEKKASDPEFMGNPWRVRNWFYQKTPYWDNNIGFYPVGKIVDRGTLAEVMK